MEPHTAFWRLSPPFPGKWQVSEVGSVLAHRCARLPGLPGFLWPLSPPLPRLLCRGLIFITSRPPLKLEGSPKLLAVLFCFLPGRERGSGSKVKAKIEEALGNIQCLSCDNTDSEMISQPTRQMEFPHQTHREVTHFFCGRNKWDKGGKEKNKSWMLFSFRDINKCQWGGAVEREDSTERITSWAITPGAVFPIAADTGHVWLPSSRDVAGQNDCNVHAGFLRFSTERLAR